MDSLAILSVRPHKTWISTGYQLMFFRTAEITPVGKAVHLFKDRKV